MSKQYLTVHTIDNAHPSQIFALATGPGSVFSASGGSSIKIHNAAAPAEPPVQIPNAHRSGCHHLATARDGPGKVLASAGFGHEVKIWVQSEAGAWEEHSTASPWGAAPSAPKVWAIALSGDEQFLACSSEAGKVAVWDVPGRRAVHLYETASEGQGSFGMSVDISFDGRMTASGHQNGTVYVFNNDSGRLVHSLTGLSKPIRAVQFSPGGTRLAAAGDAGIIAIYDTQNGEHVGNLSPSGPAGPWIMSLDWSHTGEFLVSGSFDGRVRVWSIDAAACVATHFESDQPIWAVRWLPKPPGNPRAAETFCAAGASASITLYREASGS